MRSHTLLVVFLIAALVSAASREGLGQTTYFVSPTGSDSADGLTPVTAWRSVEQANQATLGAGDKLLFERGGMWRDSLQITAQGTDAAPIIIGAYGSGSAPLFRGSDSLSAGG